ncbi:MAG TPA: DUF1501 domain-containing protein [Gemmataceae bacterium]|nr:DUF1501 domain-containing protein [Gemmataceae bacterium]
MLTIHDPSTAVITRRSFLRVGALTLSGLILSDVLRLRAEAPASQKRRPKSVVMIHLSGGPSHVDMYDMKPNAPREYRGDFRPVKTNVPGMEICELMPMQAKIADKFAILRGVQLAHLHTANEFYSGYPWQDSPRASVPNEAQRPAIGAVVSRIRGSSVIPPYVSLDNKPDWEQAYYAGLEHEPFRIGGGNSKEPLDNLRRSKNVSSLRLKSRRDLLHAFDTFRRDLDVAGTITGLDGFQARALEMVSSGKVRAAFDLEMEPDAVRNRYGQGRVKHGNHPGPVLLQARRLIEAGVSVVTACVYGAGPWDTHRQNFVTLRDLLPPLDQALSALILDLEARGLLQDVVVLMGGEFGRTPRIGDQTADGRGHWPEAGFLWIAGGGLRSGQVIGATDARGESVIGKPIRMQNVLATVYHVLGIDPATTFVDYNGRPQYLLEDREPVTQLL